MKRTLRASSALLLLLVLSLALSLSASASTTKLYKVKNVATLSQRNQVARTGAAIEGIFDDYVIVKATEREFADIKSIDSFSVQELQATAGGGGGGGLGVMDFPTGYTEYRNYSELVQTVKDTANKYSDIVSLFSVGQSYEKRDVLAVKISANPRVDTDKPEVLFVGNHHAREHVTSEMTLYLLDVLTSEYASNSTIKSIVDNLEIYIIFQLNPDGAEYDVRNNRLESWRKNTQKNTGSSSLGTDLNRNYGYKWGCCGGSSGSTSSETYRGPSAFSAIETQLMKAFVESRVISGKQQIRSAISFHSYSELVLWPFGYTTSTTPADMDPQDYKVFSTWGTEMARRNGFRPMQASQLYVADGVWDDWVYGAHKIFGFTFEMSPSDRSGPFGEGFYPKGEKVRAYVTKNREAVVHFLKFADCPYRVIGKTC